MAISATAHAGPFRRLRRFVRQLFCRHTFRDSRSLPGVRFCTKCGLHRGRLLLLS